MGKKYQALLILVILGFSTLGVFGEDTSEEAHPNYEYIQIFKSIPALFEYLLDALEERPEILEKNDVTIFKRNIDVADTDECESNDNERKTDKRDVNCKSKTPEVLENHENTNNIDKRDAKVTGEVSKTTVAYEYGNSNIVMKSADEVNVKRFSSEIVNIDDSKTLVDKNTVKREILRKPSNHGRRQGNVMKLDGNNANDLLLDYGKAFFGVEHLFGLDLKPEDIEERILTAEKLLEEHNQSKEK